MFAEGFSGVLALENEFTDTVEKRCYRTCHRTNSVVWFCKLILKSNNRSANLPVKYKNKSVNISMKKRNLICLRSLSIDRNLDEQ